MKMEIFPNTRSVIFDCICRGFPDQEKHCNHLEIQTRSIRKHSNEIEAIFPNCYKDINLTHNTKLFRTLISSTFFIKKK